jgi:TonB-dependent SusC/RagA subfamily outer membrane receptor
MLLARRTRTAGLVAALLATLLAGAGCRSSGVAAHTRTATSLDSVNVGYGREARRNVTAAITSLDGDVAHRNNPTTIADMLEGRVAGLEVRRMGRGEISVRIRGPHSITAKGEPLYVLDGIPQPYGSLDILSDLDPRDVQSIEVIKDASGTSLYGSRGANGVILITMKRPR